jgi:hypothetical protein
MHMWENLFIYGIQFATKEQLKEFSSLNPMLQNI